MIRSSAVLAFGAMAILGSPSPAATVAKSLLRVVSDRAIPLMLATDVRWIDDAHVLVTDADRGVARIGLTAHDPSISWLEEWHAPAGPGSRYFHLAVSHDVVVAADFAFGLRWRRAAGTIHDLPIEYVADVDVDRSRILVSGLRRDAGGELGADGATAWIGTLGKTDAELRPLLPFKNRAAIENCAGFGLGAVRFLADGSAIVVPSAEKNIYRYGKDGRLARVWSTDDLGVEVDCDLTRDEQIIFGTQPLARQKWVNRRAMIDDVVDTPRGPAALVRKVSDGGTTWAIAFLDDSAPSLNPLPVTAPSPWAHASADARGNDLIVLIADRVPNLPDGAPPRLVRLQWPRR